MSLCWIAGCPHNNTTILTELNRAQVLGQINLQEQQMHRNLCSSVTEDLTTEKECKYRWILINFLLL